MATVAWYLGRTLLVLTVVAAVSNAIRRNERQRLDIALFMSLLFFAGAIPQGLPFDLAIRAFLFTALSAAVSRLVGHFRSVPNSVFLVGLLIAIGFGLLEVARLPGRPVGMLPAGIVYNGLTLAAAAWIMGVEARRSLGIKARRLVFASVGTLSFAAASLVGVAFVFSSQQTRLWSYEINIYLNTVALICYFFAFNTPRWLTTRWRRAEHANHLTLLAEREPEERGAQAGEDLIDGANRCIGGSFTFVALRLPHASGSAAIDAASHAAMVGRRIAPGPGLINRVLETGVAEIGRPSDCGPDWEPTLAANGVAVLAAPIVADSHSWGVVLTVHRRGALFPHDDLVALGQLGRAAAISLDHAALVVERRNFARRESERRLRELESRVGPMLDSIKDYAMLVLDETGVVAAWHLGAQHLFGHSREQITRQPGAALFDMEPDAFDRWLREATTFGVAEREGPCRRFDGQTFIGLTSIRPLAADPDAPPGFAVVTRDVTEQRHLEDRLRQGQKMQAIGQLAGGVAHDFNNLLTAILGYADWLEHDLADDPRVAQVREVQLAAERAADLTRRLLAFSRKQMVQPSSLDLGRLVRDLLPMLHRLIGDRVAIVDGMALDMSPILGDRSQVEQVVVNLVLNARDAMPHGGEITIRAADVWCDRVGPGPGISGPHVRLEVSDTGMGMDAETRRRAFEPFFTTKDVGSGTGLGLANVYGIVQQMNGVVEIESEPNRGATFRLYFPPAPAAHPAASPESDAALLGRETVLLVEDDALLRPYLVQVLECNGYRVIAAENSDDALSVTESLAETIDLVISDVVMPGKTGPELVADLLRSRPGLPALYISGLGEAGLPRLTEQVAPSHVLQKPFSSTDLLTRVRQILTAA